MKFAFVDVEKAQWPFVSLCEMLEVSRSGYYAWTIRPEAPKVQADAEFVAAIKDAHKAGRGAYGSPRVVQALRKKGRRIGKNRVARLMRKEGIVGRKKKRFRKTPIRIMPTRSRPTYSNATSKSIRPPPPG